MDPQPRAGAAETWELDPNILVEVKHAGPETLRDLDVLLGGLRQLPGLVEKRPGVFYRKSKAFLHFHEDATGPYADLRLGDLWERRQVATTEQREALIASVKEAVSPA